MMCPTCNQDHEEGAPCQSPVTVIEEGRPGWATELATTFSLGLEELRGQVQELMTRAPDRSPPPALPSQAPPPNNALSGPADPLPAAEPTPAVVVVTEPPEGDPAVPAKRRGQKVIRLFR